MNIYRAEMLHCLKQYEGQLYIETNGKHYIKCRDEIIPDAFLQTYEINPNTLELVQLDLNDTQKAWLKNVAYKDLIAFQEGFNFLSDECRRIFFDSENYDSQVISWAIELIDKLLLKIKEANQLLKGI